MENKIVEIIKKNWFNKFPEENPTEGQMSSRGALRSAQEIVKLCNMHDVSLVERSGTTVCNNTVNKCPKYMSDKNGEKGCRGCEFYY